MSFGNVLAKPIPRDVLAIAAFADRMGRRHRSNGGDPVNLFVAFASTLAGIDPEMAAKCLVVVEAAVDAGVR